MLKLHYLIQDDAGPIVSGQGGDTLKVGNPGRWRCACDPKIVMGGEHRGTGETWLVQCAECFQTEVFQKNYQPHPRDRAADETGSTSNLMTPEVLAQIAARKKSG